MGPLRPGSYEVMSAWSAHSQGAPSQPTDQSKDTKSVGGRVRPKRGPISINVGGPCNTARMSTTFDDPITVELVDEQPAVFWWNRFPYVIQDQPLVFYRRRPPWWTGASSPDRLDDEFWRVSAAREGQDQEPSLYDLRNDGDTWRLVLAW